MIEIAKYDDAVAEDVFGKYLALEVIQCFFRHLSVLIISTA